MRFSAPTGLALAHFASNTAKAHMQRFKRFELDKMCLSFIGNEGTDARVKGQSKLAARIVSDGVCVDGGPGALYDQKFDMPCIRDFLLDPGALADVSETAAPWSRPPSLYEGVIAAANSAFNKLAVRGFIMCHLAHSHHSVACLYSPSPSNWTRGSEPLEQYDVVKAALQQSFINHGGTFSHHHAVGEEHARSLEGDLSPAGVGMIGALFDGIDSRHNLNPGKFIMSERSPVPSDTAQ